ncbi:MAG: L-threonylcarbamoyladenylate synthase [Pirellulaceae bacterium]
MDTVTTQRLDSPTEAARLLLAGGLVAFPTETVYGLGVDATNPAAVARLFTAKGRPSDNPLIVHLAAADQWSLAARELPDMAKRFLDAFAPGPLTVVLPKRTEICSRVTADLDSVAIRIPRCDLARELLAAAQRPIAAPSANRSGRPSCTTWQAVLEDLDGRIDAVLCGELSQVGLESTVIDCCGASPVLLRPGAITLEQLQAVEPRTRTWEPGREGEGNTAQPLNSPGLRHPHYQPTAQVLLFESAEQLSELFAQHDTALAVVTCQADTRQAVADLSIEHICMHSHIDSTEQYAREFYELLRQADRRGASVVLLELATEAGIGLALRDRQRRAAAK